MSVEQFKVNDDGVTLLPRTDGDGMEVVNNKKCQVIKKQTRSKQLVQHYREHFKQITPNTNCLKYMKPKLVTHKNNDQNTRTMNNFSCYNNREPRFIPKEPFKGAVTPMTNYYVNYRHKIKKYKLSKNNVDIQVLVSQMSNLASNELKNTTIQTDSTETELNDDNKHLYNEIKKLKDTNEQLEKQLRFQTQVNSELKTLLVAAVGEDLEARVQLLTQDKLQLARALLNSAQKLSSHREQVEYLAGHSEVWRSKFLASSLMVDELAKWKSILSEHINELQESIKCLLQEHNELNMNALHVFNLLLNISIRLNINHDGLIESMKSTSTNVIDLIKSCVYLSESIGLHVFNKDGDEFIKNSQSTLSPSTTYAENLAQQILTKTKHSLDDTNVMMYHQLLLKNKSTQQQQQQQLLLLNNDKCLHCGATNNINYITK